METSSGARDVSRSMLLRLTLVGALGLAVVFFAGFSWQGKEDHTRSLTGTSGRVASAPAVNSLRSSYIQNDNLERKLDEVTNELSRLGKLKADMATESALQEESESLRNQLSKMKDIIRSFQAGTNIVGENDLHRFFETYKTGPGAHKWLHYLDAYHRHFNRFRTQDKIIMVEVGVQSGGSINMWRDYFGADKLEYYGVDINPKTKQFERQGVKIHIGDQANRTFWSEFKDQVPKVDIFIDDGGHAMKQQIVTLEEMFWHLKDGSVYLCEDLHTSYWERWQGGYLKEDSMIERSKTLVDAVNAWHSKDARLKVDDWTRNIRGVHFYDSLIFIDKGVTGPMQTIKAGDQWIAY